MRLATLGAVTSLVVLAGSSAWAQTPAARPGSAAGSAAPTSTSLSAPTVNRWYAGATTGVAAVQKAGGTFSAEAG